MATDRQPGLVAQVEALARVVVRLETTDLRALAAFHEQWLALAAAAAGQRPELERAAIAAADQIEAIVLAEVPDPAAALAAVGDRLIEIERLLRDPSASLNDPLTVPEARLPEAPSPAVAAQVIADPNLVAEFVGEANEHLEAADVCLLELETDPSDRSAIDAVFRAYHTIKGVAGFLGLTDLQQLAHEAENLLDQVRQGQLVLAGSAIDVAFQATDGLKLLVAAVTEALASGTPVATDPIVPHLVGRIRTLLQARPDKKLGELLADAGLVAPDVIEQALAAQATAADEVPLGERLVAAKQASARDVALALRSQQEASQGALQLSGTVKVEAARLDRVIDAIDELRIAQSMLSQSAELREGASPQFVSRLDQVDKLTRELQQLGTALRMTPVRATFQKMARLVRDLARKAGKPIEFVTLGDESELDKQVVDQISDPLVHLLRNAVDHGIESNPAARSAAGKPEAGRITLRAFHRGGSVYIEVADDGRGLDRDAILAKAVERGLIARQASLTDQETYALIFAAGFSTAKQVSVFSGRGVGMDVVRRNTEALRGQVSIRSTQGQGTVVTMRLPLTLAIIDGMVLRVGSEQYILPTLSIVTTLRPTPESLTRVVGGGEMLSAQGGMLPLYRLGDLFGVMDAEPDPLQALAVVVDEDGRRACLLADELLGQHQVVIKSLGESLQGVRGLAGGAVLPDGRVGLLLDVDGLLTLATGGSRAQGAIGEPVHEAVLSR